MKLLAYLPICVATLFQRAEIRADLDDELRSHIQLRADDLERSGLPRPEAERRARIEFGGREKYKEQIHASLGGDFFATLWQDLRVSVRILRKSPGFTIAAVLTLALAIGANALVFGVLNALILKPLNVPEQQNLYALEHGADKNEGESYPDYVDLRDRTRAFDAIALYNIVSAGLDTGNNPSQFWGYEVSGNYFDAMKVQPFLGRFFHQADEHGPNSAPYLVISYAYWHTHFQDDRNIVGRVVQLNHHPVTILGVAPSGFQGTLLFFLPDFWFPVVNHELIAGNSVLNDRGERDFIMALGRVKPGTTRAQAIGDLNSVGSYLDKTYPKDDADMTFSFGRPSLAGDLLGPAVHGFMTGISLLAGLILLAACANLGSLFAARAADRSREVALRLALGSSRQRILRGVFTEAILISLLGGALGLACSVGMLHQLSAWYPIPSFPIRVPIAPDAKVYIVALLLALISGFLFGAVPVRQVLRTNPYEVVKAGSAGILAGGTGRRFTLRDVLLIVQIAICAVLVTSSLVAVRGLVKSMHANFGFDPENAIVVDTNLTMEGFTRDTAPAMQRKMIDALQSLPGVRSVGYVNEVPLSGGFGNDAVFTDQTTDLTPANALATSMFYRISPDYFHAAGTSLLQGRAIAWADAKDAPDIAVVNAQFARKFFGSVPDAIGRYFKTSEGRRVQIVGVVEDGKYWMFTEEPQPAMFVPLLQWPATQTEIVIRSDRDPLELVPAIRAKLRGIDAGLPFELRTMHQELGVALFAPRVATVALGVLGILGAVLSITGIFGMAAYSVSKRIKELGIRIALGAERTEVLKAALGRPLKLLAIGSAAGLILGILAGRGLAHIVYQANPSDPLVLAGVVLAMALLGLVATWIPAQRALSVNPLVLLREE
jgi:predicted permease